MFSTSRSSPFLCWRVVIPNQTEWWKPTLFMRRWYFPWGWQQSCLKKSFSDMQWKRCNRQQLSVLGGSVSSARFLAPSLIGKPEGISCYGVILFPCFCRQVIGSSTHGCELLIFAMLVTRSRILWNVEERLNTLLMADLRFCSTWSVPSNVRQNPAVSSKLGQALISVQSDYIILLSVKLRKSWGE